MLRGFRGIIVAIGLVLAAYHPNAVAQPKQQTAADRSAAALENIASRYDQQAKRAESAPESEPCEDGEYKRYSDLCAQWKAADAAELAAYLNLASIAAVMAALFLAYQSNRIARNTAHDQLRAYVTLGNVDMILRSRAGGDGKGWHIDVDLENKGVTPAFIRSFEINIGWRRRHIAPDITEEIFSKHRDIEVVIAPGKPFGIFVEIEPVLSPAALHQGDELVLEGKVEYRDIFQRPRTTRYRLYADSSCWERGAGVVTIHTSMTGNNCT